MWVAGRARMSGVVAVLTAVLIVPVTSSADTASAAVASWAGPGAAHTFRTVTLITGDRVGVNGLPGGRVSVTVAPGPGRRRVSFVKQAMRDRLTVLPSDAAPLVAAGRLDPRLFDVTELIAQGLDDSSTTTLPLIVTSPRTAGSGVRPALSAGHGELVRELPSVEGLAVRQPKAEATVFWQAVSARPRSGRAAGPGSGAAALAWGMGRIWLDGRVRASLDQSVQQVGAPRAWQAGYTGKGVKVAVLDTGYDPQHPDLAGTVAAARDFTASQSGVQDKNGHGTHVATIVAGSGAASSGRYTGVASGATLLVRKVLGDLGTGGESSIIAGMEWAAAQGAKIVNMSLGGTDTPGVGPMEAAIDKLTATHGTLFVVAAGNSGESGDGTVGCRAARTPP
jgi:hypothetical protein